MALAPGTSTHAISPDSRDRPGRMAPLEIAGNAFTLLSVWFARGNSIHTWWAGLVGVTLYGIMFFGARLYADTVLQAFFVATSITGWWQWRHGGTDGGDLAISMLSTAARIAVASAVVSGTGIAGFVFRTFTDAALPYADSFILSGSVIAQLLMMRRKLEHWSVWICVDAMAIGVYSIKELYLTAGVYALLLAMCVQGLGVWRREHGAQRATAAAV
jgi:nicotinamide mononucleotide transporter